MSVINTNIPSITAVHRLAANQNDLRTRLERLSTGLRINRGKDDPAGLIASETLRSEIRGISQSIDNSQRAINVISTAEGALNEISALLLDIRGLINHAANSGAISPEELKADQLQIDSIIEAIDRIANTTQFGGEKLLNGAMEYVTSGVAASAIRTFTIYGARVPQGSYQNVVVQVTGSAQTARLNFNASGGLGSNIAISIRGNLGTDTVALTSGSNASAVAAAINRVTDSTGVSATVSGAIVRINSQTYGSDAVVSIEPIYGTFIVAPGQKAEDKGVDARVLINGQTASVQGLTASLRTNGLDVVIGLTAARGTTLGSTSFQITGGGATFQIGPEVNPNGQVSIGIPSVASNALGDAEVGYLHLIKDGGPKAINAGNTQEAERIVVRAINQVAVIRGRLGGLQRNQIETNINSQRVALENVTAAESAIRDADIAVEVAALTRAQILVQSTTSILGIANQLPQNVLSLLR